MSSALVLVIQAVVLVVVAGLLTAADSALSTFSRARAAECLAESKTGARRLVQILNDPAPYLNTLILLRIAAEVGAVVVVTLRLLTVFDGRPTVAGWVSAAVMLVVSFVVIGVSPRTVGRQHAEPIALATAGPVVFVTRVLGPIPKLLILLGNAITPGRGYRSGPFTTETELREMVDYAEQSQLIEDVERRMIHSVFELGDTIAREVMVPRTDVVFIERHKNLRQTKSLFLRSGFSRLPVVEENLDDIVGFAYLKDVVKRDFDDPSVETTQRIDELMRTAYFVPESKPIGALLQEMQALRQHVAVVVDEYGGTAGLVTIEDILEEIVGEITDEYDDTAAQIERLSEHVARVSSRFPVDDLDELFGIAVDDDEVDSVGGLMAKNLGKVPIPGSSVEVQGLRFEAERLAGRRNKIGTVLVSPVAAPSAGADEGDDTEGDYAAGHA